MTAPNNPVIPPTTLTETQQLNSLAAGGTIPSGTTQIVLEIVSVSSSLNVPWKGCIVVLGTFDPDPGGQVHITVNSTSGGTVFDHTYPVNQTLDGVYISTDDGSGILTGDAIVVDIEALGADVVAIPGQMVFSAFFLT